MLLYRICDYTSFKYMISLSCILFYCLTQILYHFLHHNIWDILFLSNINNATVTNLPTPVSGIFYLTALSMTNMAASTGTGAAAASDSQASADPAMGGPALQYSVILDHLIGDKRPIKEVNPAVMGGLPMPPKSDEQKMIERGMESCAFKSLLACVGGECPSRFWFK